MPRLQVRQIQFAQENADQVWSRGSWLDIPSAVWLASFIIPSEFIAYEFRVVDEDPAELLPVGHPSNPVAVRIPDGWEQCEIRVNETYPKFQPKAETGS